MSQHFLYRMDIRAVFQQMGSKGMAQGVGSDIFLYTRFFLIVFHYLPEALAGHTLSADVYEEGLLVRHGNHLRPHQGYILAKSFDGSAVHWYYSLFIAAAAAYYSGTKIYITDVQIYKLTHSDACGIQQFQHGFVPVSLSVNALGLIQQQLRMQ